MWLPFSFLILKVLNLIEYNENVPLTERSQEEGNDSLMNSAPGSKRL